MTRDELRRLAIRLALVESTDGFDITCQECGRRTWNRRHRHRHTPDCPIAELEAEEAAAATKPAGKFEGEY